MSPQQETGSCGLRRGCMDNVQSKLYFQLFLLVGCSGRGKSKQQDDVCGSFLKCNDFYLHIIYYNIFV